MSSIYRTWMLAALLLGLCAAPAAHADQLEQISKAGKVRIAIINGLPSFSQLDPGLGWTGSDAETGRLLARALGVKPEFVAVSNADRISALLSRRVDIIVSALSITPEREQQIAFSLPYSSIALVIGAHPQEAVSAYHDLAGRRVGVGRNTSDGALLRQHAPNARIIEFDNEPALLKGFIDHEFDIISCQTASIALLNRRLPKSHQVEEKFIQREYQVAIGMRKEEAGLRNWINAWVGQHLRDGQLNEVFRRHHGRSLPDSVLPAMLSTPRNPS